MSVVVQRPRVRSWLVGGAKVLNFVPFLVGFSFFVAGALLPERDEKYLGWKVVAWCALGVGIYILRHPRDFASRCLKTVAEFFELFSEEDNPSPRS